jgi:hypothetical protein
MADLGDLSSFLKGGTVPNLDWLEVNAETYRKSDTLPKQNLDIVPDLEALWSHEDKPASTYVPNRDSEARTMGDLSQEHGLLRGKPADIRKVARLALMQSPDLDRLRDTLVKRFDQSSLVAARDVIASVIQERGLLGPFYIDADDFPKCASGSSKVQEFVQRYTKDARYVLAKPKCADCIHRVRGANGDICSVFHKEIQIQVPYTDAVADSVEAQQQAKGRNLGVTASEPRERIRLAMLAPSLRGDQPALLPRVRDNVVRLLRPVEATQEVEKPVDLTGLKAAARKQIEDTLRNGNTTVEAARQAYQKVAQAINPEEIDRAVVNFEAPATYVRSSAFQAFRGAPVEHVTRSDAVRSIVKMAAQYMNEGLYGKDLFRVLKARYEVRDLTAAAQELRSVLSEQGLQGIYFIDPMVYDDYGRGCKEAGRLHRTRQVPYVKIGPKCASCVHQTQPGFCSVIHKNLVVEPEYPQGKQALQREILASGSSLDNNPAQLVNNGVTMMAEFELQKKAMEVELNPIPVQLPDPVLEVEFGGDL